MKKETVACDCGPTISSESASVNSVRFKRLNEVSEDESTYEDQVSGNFLYQATYSNVLPNHGKYLYTNIILYMILYLHQHYRYLSVSRGVFGYYGVRTYL